MATVYVAGNAELALYYAVLTILAVLGLLLPFRKFFPKEVATYEICRGQGGVRQVALFYAAISRNAIGNGGVLFVLCLMPVKPF